MGLVSKMSLIVLGLISVILQTSCHSQLGDGSASKGLGPQVVKLSWLSISEQLNKIKNAAPESEYSLANIRKTSLKSMWGEKIEDNIVVDIDGIRFDNLPALAKGRSGGFVAFTNQYRTMGDLMDASGGGKSADNVSVEDIKASLTEAHNILRQQGLVDVGLKAENSSASLALGSVLGCTTTSLGLVGTLIGTAVACVTSITNPASAVACGTGGLGLPGAVFGVKSQCSNIPKKQKQAKKQQEDNPEQTTTAQGDKNSEPDSKKDVDPQPNMSGYVGL